MSNMNFTLLPAEWLWANVRDVLLLTMTFMLQIRPSEVIPLIIDTPNSFPTQLPVTSLNVFPMILIFSGFIL